jgi:hypothetical protein
MRVIVVKKNYRLQDIQLSASARRHLDAGCGQR